MQVAYIDEVESDVFVEGVEDGFGYPLVGEGPVDEQQAFEEAELGDGVVAG